MKGYLGCDIGSVSLKMVVVDDSLDILASIYLKNSGLTETIKEGLSEISTQLGDVEIASVGCAGSGREFTKVLLGGDITKTEILAHTIATMHYYPDVNTIFDIGGEDCKIITLKDGVWRNYIMNSICGAGTGAMLESMARTLNIQVSEIGELALKSRQNLSFPGKCGVLCQSAVVSRKNKGAKTEDILMGVCRALISNYLNSAKSITLEPPYVFQGETAKNKALVKALEEQLGAEVTVPRNCGLMGAVGMAILAKENEPESTNFRGFSLKDLDIDTDTFMCDNRSCANNCEITKISVDGRLISYLGSRCGRYDAVDDSHASKQKKTAGKTG